MKDLEIYIKESRLPAIQSWLHGKFGRLEWQRRGNAIRVRFERDGTKTEVTLFPEAFRGFCCITLEAETLPWPDDLACARDAREALGVEVRCSVGGWSEADDPEDEWWWRLDDRGEQKVRWN